MAFRIELLKSAQREQAFELVTRVFVQHSTLHRAMGITLSQYRSYLCPSFDQMVAEGLSVVAVDDRSGKMVGCLIATDFAAKPCAPETIAQPFAPIAALSAHVWEQYWRVRTPVPGYSVLVDMGAVDPLFQGQGIYQDMRKALHNHAKDAGYQRVVGELSSAATQHTVLHKFGHSIISQVDFQRFTYAGQTPFRTITEPAGVILAQGILTP